MFEQLSIKNKLRIEDLERCLGGLGGIIYHDISKELHGHRDVVIDERDFADNEIFLLGVLFTHYNIKFSFYNKDGNMDDYPYDMLCIMDKE